MKQREEDSPSGLSRRGFLSVSGAGLLAAATKVDGQITSGSLPARSEVRFVPDQALVKVSPSLYLLRDTCNVYVIKDGNSAVLVDFGSGHVLELLGHLGVTKVDAILHTHHHRDQCQGDWRAVEQQIPIYVPAYERYLFEEAENFWRNRRIYHQYKVRNDFFTVTRNIKVTGVLQDYETFRWGTHELLIFPTPGHSVGAVSLVGTVDGRRIAFTGDLIHSPGKVVNLHELQYDYERADGLDCAIFSLTKLKELSPELLCPSHGEPMPDPVFGVDDLIQKLRTLYDIYGPGWSLSADNRPYAVTPHLLCSPETLSNNYALLSDSGKALFIDYGTASGSMFSSFKESGSVHDRIRFVEHTIPELKARYGMKSIDVAMPTHIHDDHLNGFPHLVKHYGAKVWCYENMVDILQNPRGNNLGCILAEPIRVDRSIRDGETFRWEEYEFTVRHSPGHTEYQMAMFGEVDGARIAFTGDAIFPFDANWQPSTKLRHNVIYRNWVENDSHLKSIRTILEYEPTLMAPGHGKPFLSSKDDLEEMRGRLEQQQRCFQSLIADPDCDFGLNPSWIRLYPYQMLIYAGKPSALELRVRNYRSKTMQVEASLVVPAGWKASPQKLTVDAAPKGWGAASFSVTAPVNWDRREPRVALTADVVVDSRYLGEIAECVADVQVGV